jgi:hypothetical protein
MVCRRWYVGKSRGKLQRTGKGANFQTTFTQVEDWMTGWNWNHASRSSRNHAAPHLPPAIASESVTTFIGVSRRSRALGFVMLL